MRRPILIFAAFAILTSGGIAAPPEAAAAAAPADCGTVTRSTTLKRDCLGPLTVAADGIRVNLGARKVICNRPVDGIVLEGRSRVSIVNGHVHGCEIGVRIDGGSANALEDLHVDGNAWQGILIRGSSDNVVRSTRILRNGTPGRLGSRGIMVQKSADGVQSDRNFLDGVTARDNTAYGIEINGSSNNRLVSVVADGNAAGGISIDGLATWTTVESSSGSNNGGFGVFVSGSGTSITSSTFSSNTGTRGFGVQLSVTAVDTAVDRNAIDANVVGIRIGGPGNTVSDNTLAGNTRDGIALGVSGEATGPTGNILSGNSATGSGRYDLADYVVGECDANEWHGNSGTLLYDGCETTP